MQTSNDALSEAFHLLEESVRHLPGYGRQCLGARPKPELRRRTHYTFSEQLLGFAKFGDFLRAAERAGVIHFGYTPGGDLAISLARTQPSQPVFASGVGSVPPAWTRPRAIPPITLGPTLRVRDDLWNAFNSFSSQWVYDRNSDLARRLPDGAQTETAPDLIRIPAGRERVVNWMRSFAGTQDAATKTHLLSTLSGDSPIYHFKIAVEADPNLRRAWRRYHVQQVLAAIEAWSASNNVHPKDVSGSLRRISPPYPFPQPSEVPAASPVPVVPNPALPLPTQTTLQQTTLLTPRLATLIDELINELLRLRGTLQVIEPRS